MAAEYLKSKEELLERLRSSAVQNLRRLQEQGVEAEFVFIQKLDYQERDSKTRPKFSVFRRFSEIFDHQEIPTWNRYTYKDGTLKAERIQHERVDHRSSLDYPYNTPGITVEGIEDISPENIPFAEFSEWDLIDAAKTIEKHLPKPAEVV